MKAVLVPVGSSKNAVSHLQYAVDFARAFGTKLYVVQVFNVYTKAGTILEVDDILERESLEFLKSHVSKVDTSGIEVIIKTFKGKLVPTLELVCKTAGVDLLIVEPRTNSKSDEVYLGKTSGKIIKQTNIPALIVPEGYKFVPISTIMMALKFAVIKKENALRPLIAVKSKFESVVKLLLVKTPFYTDGDFDVKGDLVGLIDDTYYCDSATAFQGVLKNHERINPDLLCVVRRKRGFFNKLWENDTILKKDFSFAHPVLVLSGLK